MKRIVVSCDGTWNTPDQMDEGRPAPTNVVKLHNCVLDRDQHGTQQLKYYHPGVGTEGSLVSRSAGGAYGKGLSRNIQSAYRWLSLHHQEGDAIFLFGFSRGAFTVRSLAGMIGRCGLLEFRGVDVPDQWQRTKFAYERCYRGRVDVADLGDEEASWFRNGGDPVQVRFIGVWDTVGALGIPNDFALLNLLDRPEAWSFHDTKLGKNVTTARHAVALDEARASFTPTLWRATAGRDVEQVWFPGVHSDVGGGYADSGLSDGALKWMIEQAEDADLEFHAGMREQILENPLGTIHDSVTGVFKALRTRPRATPPIRDGVKEVHPGAVRRHTTPPITQAPYRPTITLAKGQEIEVDVFARERWNVTGLFLPAGEYRFHAEGEWLDSRVKCGPGGTNDGSFHPMEVAHLLGTTWGFAERAWKKITRNDGADFWGTKRVESAPWFALIGVIANDNGAENPDCDGSPSPHERFVIGDGIESRKVKTAGYLYAFANDAWSKYENNRGSVRLKVKRLR